MADVLIVCVREDEPQAKALAEMFEAAGFSIGGAPSNDGALRSSGAGVIVWSQASIRSRPFLDAAQRVINAGKAVVASLIEPPPPSSIGSSPAFDLSQWDGDPNDPALDPLFFAVDRLVNAARAGVGASTQIADPQTYEPPPAPSRPPRQSAPAPQPSYRSPPAPDHLGAETEYWRAIRDSRNPADFMDYLARYGADGAFSEVAELRLKQLAGSGEQRAPSRPVRPSAPAPSSRPVVRSEAPPPRLNDPPLRRSDLGPPPRRTEAPLPRRAPVERSYDRYEPQNEPPRGEGGALRAFVLIALLGAALAGGLYVGGGLNFGGGQGSQEQSEAASGDAVAAAPTEAPASIDPNEPDSYALPDASTPAPPASATQARRDQQNSSPAPVRSASPPTPQRAAEADGPPPAPVTSWGSGGPISLSPAQQASAPTNSAPVPLSPPAQPQEQQQLQVASVEPMVDEPTVRAAPAIVAWAQRPSARRISELYPDRALRSGADGRVQLDCVVQSTLAVACTVASETPAGQGFGRAALTAANSYRAQPYLSDGTSAVGKATRITVNFRAHD